MDHTGLWESTRGSQYCDENMSGSVVVTVDVGEDEEEDVAALFACDAAASWIMLTPAGNWPAGMARANVWPGARVGVSGAWWCMYCWL